MTKIIEMSSDFTADSVMSAIGCLLLEIKDLGGVTILIDPALASDILPINKYCEEFCDVFNLSIDYQFRRLEQLGDGFEVKANNSDIKVVVTGI